jgi:hypothetical protein
MTCLKLDCIIIGRRPTLESMHYALRSVYLKSAISTHIGICVIALGSMTAQWTMTRMPHHHQVVHLIKLVHLSTYGALYEPHGIYPLGMCENSSSR